MLVTRTVWIRNTAIVMGVIAYLVFATAIVVGQSETTDEQKRKETADAKILISGKPVKQVQEKPRPDQNAARIILTQDPVQAPPATIEKKPMPPVTTAAPNVVEPQRKLVAPIRPGTIPKSKTPKRIESSTDSNLTSATNARKVHLPQPSPKMENVKLANPPIVNASQSSTIDSGDRPGPHPPASTIRISDLPTVEVSQANDSVQPITSQAIYYPSTTDSHPIAKVTGTAQEVKKEQEPAEPSPFQNREKLNMLQPVMPAPIEIPGKDKEKKRPDMDPRVKEFLSSGEFLHDGGDRNLQTVVGSDWSVQGLDTEDTVGHFDTLDGDRVVVPSNRVSIYAPRFSAVQKIDGLVSANSIEHMAKVDEKVPTYQSGTFDIAANSKQQTSTVRNIGKRSAIALQDRTRGLTVDNTHHLAMNSNVVASNKIHNFLLTGRLNNSEKAFLATAMQSAITWSSDMEVQIAVKHLQTKTIHDVKSANETITVDPIGKKSKLRVVKMADKRSAQPGDEIEFMIRFDNVGEELIGNVTILDNLTGRLEYIEKSASCSVKADLITSQNDAQSTQLRWEIVEPLKIGTGGVIKFKCRVR